MTALEMAGISISLLPDHEDSSLTSLLDANTNAHAWVPAANLLDESAQHSTEMDEYMDTLISGSTPVMISGGNIHIKHTHTHMYVFMRAFTSQMNFH